jgi:alcohol dehydrogenase class IV
MDALTHAVESYLCLFVSKKCKRFSEEAVRIIFENIEKAYADGNDLHAREQMLAAAYLGGAAFTRAGLNYIHPVAHTLSGLYKEAHGRANAVIMPHVLEYYGAPVHSKLAHLAVCAGLPVSGMSDADAAHAFIEAIKELNRKLGIPAGFDYIRDGDVPQICSWAIAEANPFYPVPILYGKEEIAEIVSLIRTSHKEDTV